MIIRPAVGTWAGVVVTDGVARTGGPTRDAVPPGTAGTSRVGSGSAGDQRICIPEMAREMTSRWISEVPSKMV